jgi:hypothetical protein
MVCSQCLNNLLSFVLDCRLLGISEDNLDLDEEAEPLAPQSSAKVATNLLTEELSGGAPEAALIPNLTPPASQDAAVEEKEVAEDGFAQATQTEDAQLAGRTFEEMLQEERATDKSQEMASEESNHGASEIEDGEIVGDSQPGFNDSLVRVVEKDLDEIFKDDSTENDEDDDLVSSENKDDSTEKLNDSFIFQKNGSDSEQETLAEVEETVEEEKEAAEQGKVAEVEKAAPVVENNLMDAVTDDEGMDRLVVAEEEIDVTSLESDTELEKGKEVSTIAEIAAPAEAGEEKLEEVSIQGKPAPNAQSNVEK